MHFVGVHLVSVYLTGVYLIGVDLIGMLLMGTGELWIISLNDLCVKLPRTRIRLALKLALEIAHLIHSPPITPDRWGFAGFFGAFEKGRALWKGYSAG